MCKVNTKYGVGFKGASKTGEEFEVVEYNGRKNITIRFSCGLERNTTSTHIKQNRVIYSTKRVAPILIGEEFQSLEGTSVVVVGLKPNKKYIVRFPCGFEKEYSHSTLIMGEITSKRVMQVGDTFVTTRYGVITVVKYINAHNVTVRFEDGAEVVVQAASIRKGNVGHPLSGLVIGQIFVNGDGCVGSVVDFKCHNNVTVCWEDGEITSSHQAAQIKKGSIYYPNFKSVCGVGYFGVGKYKSDKCGKTGNYNKRVYASWQRMIRRCYDENEQKKPSCKAYIGVSVCEDWHNFQNFALWAEDKEDKFVKGWDLDKDMFGDGWEYNPRVCTLLPSKVNVFLSDGYSWKPSGLPEGVNFIAPKTPKSSVGYVARCHVNGKREYLGYYKTPEEAGNVYRVVKEKEGKRLAQEYRDVLTKEQYDKLSTFRLEDIHRKTKDNRKGLTQ